MTRRPRLAGLVAALAALLGLGIVIGAAGLIDPDARAQNGPSARRADAVVTLGPTSFGRAIPPGFLGISVEYPALRAYTGSDPRAVDPVFEQLLRNLAPAAQPVSLRIGGDSTDTTWWPVERAPRPPGVTYTLTRRWLATTGALARAIDARLILGIDLEAGRPALAAAEGRTLLAGIGRGWISALEIGNEAPRYSAFPWYHASGGRPVFARPASYSFDAFSGEFAGVARLLPSAPLAGPTLGGFTWIGRGLGPFLTNEPALRTVTFHSYPLDRCFTKPGSPTYATVPRLLSRFASRGLAQAVERYVALAHRRGLAFRVDELNSVACGGKRGVSDTFASALWALDTLFAMARSGVDGVNVHTFPGAAYELFAIRHVDGQWLASVRPEYYALLMFAQAAPPGSRLLALRTTGALGVRAWATRATDGSTRVVLINDDLAHAHVVALRGATGAAPATLERLAAPAGARATRGVTLGGQSFGAETDTGTPAGVRRTVSAPSVSGGYKVALRPASAAMITIP